MSFSLCKQLLIEYSISWSYVACYSQLWFDAMGSSRCKYTLLVLLAFLGLAVPAVLSQTTITGQNPAVSSLTNGYIYPERALEGTESLYFGLMMSFGGTLKSSGVIPGVQVALDFINNNKTRSGVLKNYTLHFILYDSQVSKIIVAM